MKRIALGVALLLCAISAVAADAPATPEIVAPSNGEQWLRLSSTEKLFWAIGYAQGFQDALGKIDITSGPGTPCSNLAERTEKQSSAAGKISGFELVTGLERFYAEPANLVIPVGSAVRIYLLQAAGKDAGTIQELIDTARLLGNQARRTVAPR